MLEQLVASFGSDEIRFVMSFLWVAAALPVVLLFTIMIIKNWRRGVFGAGEILMGGIVLISFFGGVMRQGFWATVLYFRHKGDFEAEQAILSNVWISNVVVIGVVLGYSWHMRTYLKEKFSKHWPALVIFYLSGWVVTASYMIL